MRTLEEAEAYIAKEAHAAAAGSAFYYAVRERKTKRQIGQLQIKNLQWKAKSAELGYFVDAEWRRRGVGEELVEIALQELFAKRGFRRVVIRAIPGNEASLGLARKMGFREEGVLRSEFLTGRGEWADVVVTARTQERALQTPLLVPQENSACVLPSG
jgi:RimJ/RimL family protein N-acetyltransferase